MMKDYTDQHLNQEAPVHATRLEPTSSSGIPFRLQSFLTITEALEDASRGASGLNFYNGKAELAAAATYDQIREMAISIARRMHTLGLPRGSKVALIAETDMNFVNFFFACQYAGLVPVSLPAVVNMKGGDAYIKQIRGLIEDSQSRIVLTTDHFLGYINQACEGLKLVFCDTYTHFVTTMSESDRALDPLGPDEVAYIQYTSGSTRAPRGVMVKSEAVMANLAALAKAMGVDEQSRYVSWLPFYHDMGLIGLMLNPMASHASVDYLGTREFAVRPRLWFQLLSKTKASHSCSPPFGYDLGARRLRQGGAERYDLSNWRVAVVGAEMIHPETLQNFAKVMASSGFSPKAFLPSYGMAECSLGISFSSFDEELVIDTIDRNQYEETGVASQCDESTKHRRAFVSCGQVIAGHEIQIRNDQGHKLDDRHIGVIHVRGPSLMCGYLGQPEVTAQTLSENGWLNTGDLGYMADGHLFVTGRQKDLIIIHGRNVWPQDLESVVEVNHGVHPGKVLAFSVAEGDAGDHAVVVIESREQSESKKQQLIQNVKSTISESFGISCEVVLVQPRTLPRTSSGKLSRSQAKINYIQSLKGLEQAS